MTRICRQIPAPKRQYLIRYPAADFGRDEISYWRQVRLNPVIRREKSGVFHLALLLRAFRVGACGIAMLSLPPEKRKRRLHVVANDTLVESPQFRTSDFGVYRTSNKASAKSAK